MLIFKKDPKVHTVLDMTSENYNIAEKIHFEVGLIVVFAYGVNITKLPIVCLPTNFGKQNQPK